jgi:hypothetical protein
MVRIGGSYDVRGVTSPVASPVAGVFLVEAAADDATRPSLLVGRDEIRSLLRSDLSLWSHALRSVMPRRVRSPPIWLRALARCVRVLVEAMLPSG